MKKFTLLLLFSLSTLSIIVAAEKPAAQHSANELNVTLGKRPRAAAQNQKHPDGTNSTGFVVVYPKCVPGQNQELSATHGKSDTEVTAAKKAITSVTKATTLVSKNK